MLVVLVSPEPNGFAVPIDNGLVSLLELLFVSNAFNTALPPNDPVAPVNPFVSALVDPTVPAALAAAPEVR